MIVKDPALKPLRLLPATALIVFGLLLGSLLEPITWWQQEYAPPPKNASTTSTEVTKFKQALKTPAPIDNGLKTLSIHLEHLDAATIERVREQALLRGQIVQGEEDTVPAAVTMDGKNLVASVRIKGDWLDHVSTDKWSLRVVLEDGKLMGMRTFSIQHPHTRGWLWEWVVHEAARYEGLLAPRSTFINVVINNKNQGIFFLEEHFSKELLESQGRREGPIVLFDESTAWASYLQNHTGALNSKPKMEPALAISQKPGNASFRAFGEGRLQKLPGLNRSLNSAIGKMKDLQRDIISADSSESRMLKMSALYELEGNTIDSLMDVPEWARQHALLSLFQVWHGLIWHNVRFYYNPVSDRLEPITYDNMAHTVESSTPVIFTNNPIVKRLASSETYYHTFFDQLNTFATGAWLDGFKAHINDDLQRYTLALDGEKELATQFRPEQMFQRLAGHQIYLQELLAVKDPINFDCIFTRNTTTNIVDGELTVNAWSTTRIPVMLDGFRLHDGSRISARSALVPDQHVGTVRNDGGVMLPHDRRPLTFRFPVNTRLTNLSNVDEIKRNIRKGEAKGGPALDKVTALFRLHGRAALSEEELHFRITDDSNSNGGRPSAPGLDEALKAHTFLRYNFNEDSLYVVPGVHDVVGDLLVPAGYPLHAGPGVTLRFAPGNLLYSESPLIFKGSKERPVTLEPLETADSFSGILVRYASLRSHWQHVLVRGTNSLTRAGWATTGGITFYHSPVTILDSEIKGTLAEDGTNIFGTDFLMERVTFSGCVSDSFDGDFIKGIIRDCTFEDGEADGVDLSGSEVEVINCKFKRLGDKAISVGEHTRCTVQGGEIFDTAIGIASKDLSQTKVQGTRFSQVRGFNFAVYTKKAEFGPSQVEAVDITLEGPAKNLVQTGSTLKLNGQDVPGQNIDVGQLYNDKVLGN